MNRRLFVAAALAALLVPAFASTAVTTPTEGAAAAAPSQGLRQFEARSPLADGTQISITVVAYQSEEGRANAAMSQAMGRAQSFYRELFGEGGVEAALGNLKAGESLALPPDSYSMISKAVDIAAVTGGWFDIAGPSPAGYFTQRDWRRIHLDPEARTVTMKSDGMKLDLRRISLGYAADIAMEAVAQAGFANAKVDVGPVSRIAGRDIFTPWSIQVNFGNAGSSAESAHAHRALSYNVTNIASATVTGKGLGEGLIDPKNRKPVPANKMLSITVLAADATTATAYALASWTLGPRIGMRFVEAHPEVRGILVDNTGKLAASVGLAAATPSAAPSPEASGTEVIASEPAPPENAPRASDGGTNDLKQKALEEEREL